SSTDVIRNNFKQFFLIVYCESAFEVPFSAFFRQNLNNALHNRHTNFGLYLIHPQFSLWSVSEDVHPSTDGRSHPRSVGPWQRAVRFLRLDRPLHYVLKVRLVPLRAAELAQLSLLVRRGPSIYGRRSQPVQISSYYEALFVVWC
ncbi:hypothetical protein L9F63_011369, partial [Diploptera punctata]